MLVNMLICQSVFLYLGSGLNYSKYSVASYDIDTPNNGLVLEMKLDKSELCGNDEIKNGFGFRFCIHRKERIPTFVFNKFYSLSTGYSTRVSLSKVNYIRKTEHLGRCATQFKLFLTPNASEYFQDICRLQCYTEIVANLCQCMLPHSAPYRKIFLKKLKINVTDENSLKLCDFQKFKCMNDLYRKGLAGGDHFLRSMCHKCPEPCQDEEYKIQMSSLLKKQPKGLNQTFLNISFGFGSMNVETVVESQAFTIRDFFIYVGNDIILYLGMSFMSSFEILDLILHLFFAVAPAVLQKGKRNTKLQRIYINPKCECPICKRTKYVYSRRTCGNKKLRSKLKRK